MGKFKLRDLERDTVLELELTDAQFAELKGFLKELKTPAGTAEYRAVLEKYNAVCKICRPRQGSPRSANARYPGL